MSEATDPQRSVPSVLVIAVDPNIESLVGELVAFAGYRPMYDVTAGAAGESVRRARPDVTLLDTALESSVVRACLTAADEVGSQPVLMSSTASTSELVEEARAQGCLFFELPGGPKPLGRILDRAINERPRRSVTALAEPRESQRAHGSLHPALCAAIASVARARAIAIHAEQEHKDTEALRDETLVTLMQTRRSYRALRAAVTDYTRQLKGAELGEEAAVEIVHDAIVDCATVVGAESSMPTLLRESEHWARSAYRAA